MDVVSQALQLAENEHMTALDLRGNGQLTAAGVRKVLRVLRESKVESIELGGRFGVSEQAMEKTPRLRCEGRRELLQRYEQQCMTPPCQARAPHTVGHTISRWAVATVARTR